MRAAKEFLVKALASCFFLTYPIVRVVKARGICDGRAPDLSAPWRV